ncbi:hypothetical protein BH10ACT1_BH10ACT1_17900 [soil metagenome]
MLVVVPDPDELYAAFAAGLRAAHGRLPAAGIPRLLRPRKKFGTVRGFSVVDPGGNWLRVSKLGDSEDGAKKERTTGLARVIENAARHGDGRGAEAEALRLLNGGLERFADAPPTDRMAALDMPISTEERAGLADEISHAQALIAEM